MSQLGEERRRYTIVMDLWRAPGEDLEKFEGVESPDVMEVVDEARFNLESAGRAQEATYWLSEHGWTVNGAYDAVVVNRAGLARAELARHLLHSGLYRQVVEEYDSETSHRPSRLVHLDPDTLRIEEWPEAQNLEHDPEHCALCLSGEKEAPTPPEPNDVLMEAEMVLAAATLKQYVRRSGLQWGEVLALFYGYGYFAENKIDPDDFYPMIDRYKEYREELKRQGIIDE